jgi:hypothetical protein
VAIYSFNVSSIGKATHAAGTAGAHLAYIGRADASPTILANNIPAHAVEARSWMDRAERGDRANARLGDKLRIALPRELSFDERSDLVRDFMAQIGGDRVSWFAGIHQSGDDRHNPHVHIFVRDRDHETGRRVLKLSDSARDRAKAGLEPKAVDWLRERWETICNAHLERAGVDARIDRRTLDAQNIDRVPTIHLGPRGQVIEQFVQRPASKKVRNALGREVDYVTIDQGRTRRERHAEIEDINLERAIRSPNFETRERAKWEKEQRKLDRDLEKKLIETERKLTIERRALRGRYRTRFNDLKVQQSEEQAAAHARVDAIHKPIASALRRAQASERLDLRIRSSSVWQRLLLAIDFTGQAKGRREAARHALSVRHQGQRQVVINNRKTALTRTEEAVAARLAPQRQKLIQERDEAMREKRHRHMEVRKIADQSRQDRETQRERGRRQLDSFIAVAKSHLENRSRPAPGRDLGR